MRKELVFLILLIGTASLVFLSCATTEDEARYIKMKGIILTRETPSHIVNGDFEDDADGDTTRSAVTFVTKYENWFQNKDTLGIFPEGGYQIPFEVKLDPGVDKAASVVLNAEGWETKEGVTYATYMPFDFYNRYSTHIPFSYLGQVQNYTSGENYNTDHLGKYLYERSSPMMPDSEGFFYAEMQNIGCFIRFRCTLPAGTPDIAFQKLVISSTNPNQFIVKGTLDLFGEGSPLTPTEYAQSYTIPLNDMKMNASRQIFVFLMIGAPCVIGGSTFSAYLYSNSGYTYAGTKEVPAGTADIARNSNANINFTMTLQTSPQDVMVNEFSDDDNQGGVAIE